MAERSADWLRQAERDLGHATPSRPSPVPPPSSTSVGTRFLDRAAVWDAIVAHARALAREHPHVRRVVVFGSFARDRAVPGSDVDLLIVLDESRERFLDRIPRFLPDRFPVGVDVFPYTREEIERMLAEGNPFARRALAEGIEVYPGTPGTRGTPAAG